MHAVSPLPAWESFYVIVGSSAAALTGLMFVVVVLIAEARYRDSSPESIAAFGTPTIVHFCAALLVSVILSSPWHRLASAGLVLAACGLAGTIYTAIVIKRARRQKGYAPVLEDWLWHTVFPLVTYTAIAADGALLRIHSHVEQALFIIGAGTTALLFIGIHNAWDAVTFVTLQQLQRADEKKD